MTIAKARYTGRMRTHTVKCPSGRTYTLPNQAKAHAWVAIDDREDAAYLAEQQPIEVEWSTSGKLLARGKEILSEGYQKKRSIASELGLSFEEQPDEETLDDKLGRYIEQME